VERVTLEAPDICCDHCIQSIHKAVEQLPGVTFIAGDPSAQKVTVEYDPGQAQLGQIEAAMEEEGYPVKH
jgi:copper chaperone